MDEIFFDKLPPYFYEDKLPTRYTVTDSIMLGFETDKLGTDLKNWLEFF